ncbi:hypothetical protein WJX79_010555 [Trebouxia sp. C0005]
MWPFDRPINTGAQDQARSCKGDQQRSGTHDPRHYLLASLIGGGVLLSCRFIQRYKKQRSAERQKRDFVQAALHAEARAQAALAAQSRQYQYEKRTHSRHGIKITQGSSAATGPITESRNQAETSRQPEAAAKQGSQGSRTSQAYDIFNPPQYHPDPDAARSKERRLSAWEDALVKHPGMVSHQA